MIKYKELLKELYSGQHDIFNQPEGSVHKSTDSAKRIEYRLTKTGEAINIIYIDRKKKLRLTNTITLTND
jgi:regulation of enolase protein 1 (concanavalin A-like superfamily)